jgi:poly(A) polymerase Pap1
MAATRQWGITPPVSTAFPTDKDLALSEALLAELKEQKSFESTEDTNKRVAVLATFQKVVTEFVKHVGRTKGLSDSVLQNAGGKVFTFGSYRLGVYSPGKSVLSFSCILITDLVSKQALISTRSLSRPSMSHATTSSSTSVLFSSPCHRPAPSKSSPPCPKLTSPS